MPILPRQTQPPKAPIERRHHPKEATGRRGYRTYRPCLRWEFGFTCPFCLLHEADLARTPAEGTGQTAIEHFEPQSIAKSERNNYSNCFYICKYCNEARSNLSVTSNGRRLLNPTDAAWGDHFELTEAKLRPLNDNAAYTEQSYDINDPRRTVLRAERARVYDDHVPLMEQSDSILELLDLATQQTNVEARIAIIAAAEMLRNAVRHAVTDLRGYSIVPMDAPKACKCVDVELELPEALVSQTLSMRSTVEVAAPSE